MSELVLNIPLNEKQCLTVKEASALYNIGIHAMRSLTKIPGNTFTLKIGSKILIKRESFDRYISQRTRM